MGNLKDKEQEQQQKQQEEEDQIIIKELLQDDWKLFNEKVMEKANNNDKLQIINFTTTSSYSITKKNNKNNSSNNSKSNSSNSSVPSVVYPPSTLILERITRTPSNANDIIINNIKYHDPEAETPLPLTYRGSGDSVSFYPPPIGNPIADNFRVLMLQGKIVFAIADGCGWGSRPDQASQAGVKAFTDYFMTRKMTDSHMVAKSLVSAMAISHHRVKYSASSDAYQSGTTTICGGYIAPVDFSESFSEELYEKSGKVKSGPFSRIPGNIVSNILRYVCSPACALVCKAFYQICKGMTGKFMISSIGVGDCSAHIYNKKLKKSSVIWYRDLPGLDPRDPGGRLGGYNKNEWADLRNQLYTEHFGDEGDYIILLTDGVHDNYQINDDENQDNNTNSNNNSNNSNSSNSSSDNNSNSSNKNFSSTKYKALDDMNKIIESAFAAAGNSPNVSQFVVEKILGMTKDKTAHDRDWLIQNPALVPPATHTARLDHSTCVVFQVKLWSL